MPSVAQVMKAVMPMVLGLVLSGLMHGQSTPSDVPPIKGEEAVWAAAIDVEVSRIDLEILLGSGDASDYESPAEVLLWDTFANQPAERRFSTLVGMPGREYWDIFAEQLREKARRMELDTESLARCLVALNYGRNRETAWWPAQSIEAAFIQKDATPEEIAEMEARARREEQVYRERLKYREAHIEEFYVDEDELGIVPVAAYEARSEKGPSWVIVCKWEYFSMGLNGGSDNEAMLGHVMIWAMDAATCEVIGYVSCD